jgi:hypothetical protein
MGPIMLNVVVTTSTGAAETRSGVYYRPHAVKHRFSPDTCLLHWTCKGRILERQGAQPASWAKGGSQVSTQKARAK